MVLTQNLPKQKKKGVYLRMPLQLIVKNWAQQNPYYDGVHGFAGALVGTNAINLPTQRSYSTTLSFKRALSAPHIHFRF